MKTRIFIIVAAIAAAIASCGKENPVNGSAYPQFDKPETLRLRNRLISELNRNITGILAEDPTTGIDNASCDAI